jgi:hypothetical protein
MKFSHMCAISALAGVASVSAVTANTVTFAEGAFNFGPGGEFIANLDNGNSYRTFCLERFEAIATDGTVYQYDINSGEFGAVEGGEGAGGSDRISNATAQIFVNWLNGTIPNNAENNDAVQYAIWYLESEINFGTIQGAFGSAVADRTQDILDNFTGGFNTTPGASDFDSANFPNIRILNPYQMIGGQRVEFQSQIILIPLPTASGMALAGLALVGGIRRRK